MKAIWRRTLEALLASGGLPLTAIPSSMRGEMQKWGLRTGTLALVRQGRGARLQVVNADHLGALVRKEFPSIPLETPEANHGRIRNLAYARDTKAGDTRLGVQYILGKAVGDLPLAMETTAQVIDLKAWMASLGCFALPITSDFPAWKISAPMILVENQALFDNLNWLPSGWSGILLYYAGNLSDLVLDWVTRSTFPSVTIFPDYDGMGLRNFSRLQTVLPSARWHWENDWEEALDRYGNADLWRKDKQRAEFDALWKKWEKEGWPDADLRLLMEVMRRQGRMLEQEWVLARHLRK